MRVESIDYNNDEELFGDKVKDKNGIVVKNLTSKQPMTIGKDDDDENSNGFNGEERVKDLHQYEVNKYMQKNIRPIHMPRMATFKRAEDHDPGQSSTRADMETNWMKNLIISYFGTVRKSMNDMVPKTVMAFLVNKSKN
jgi:hypothetical protein